MGHDVFVRKTGSYVCMCLYISITFESLVVPSMSFLRILSPGGTRFLCMSFDVQTRIARHQTACSIAGTRVGPAVDSPQSCLQPSVQMVIYLHMLHALPRVILEVKLICWGPPDCQIQGERIR